MAGGPLFCCFEFYRGGRSECIRFGDGTVCGRWYGNGAFELAFNGYPVDDLAVSGNCCPGDLER
jgi:hypothetical protein